MKYSELEAELTAAGCWVIRKGGNHLIWYSPITDKKFPLGHHGSKEVPPPTERSVRRLSGVKKSWLSEFRNVSVGSNPPLINFVT